MSYAIAPASVGNIAKVSENRLKNENTASLDRIAQKFAGIQNTSTLLRLKDDGRIKLMPGKLPYLTKVFSGGRYAREAESAQRYFGLPELATVKTAGAKVQQLTSPVLYIKETNFPDKTPEELLDLKEKLSTLDGKTLLHFDLKTIRPACRDTDPEQIAFAQEYFGLDTLPSVDAVKKMIEEEGFSLAIEAENAKVLKEKIKGLPDLELRTLLRELPNSNNALPLVFNSPREDVNSRVEIQTTVLQVRIAIANELHARDRNPGNTKNAARVDFDTSEKVFDYQRYSPKAARLIPLRDEAEKILGNAMDHPDIRTFFDVAQAMAANGESTGKVIGQLALELCADTFTESSARQHVSEALARHSPEDRRDLTELVLTVHRQYLAMTSS